jgi:magnesium chelatase accessory protein
MSEPGSAETLEVDGLHWRVRRVGDGPTVLLLHGTGATGASWRELTSYLSADFHVIAPDLPGHGGTELPAAARMSLPGVADSVAGLIRHLGATPTIVAGHSAGAAIGARLTLDGHLRPRLLVGINPALAAMDRGPPRVLAPLVNRIATSAFTTRFLARLASQPGRVERVLQASGTRLDARSVEAYRGVASDPRHVAGAMTMMARWDLRPLLADLPRLDVPLLLLLGEADRWIDRGAVERACRDVRDLRLEVVPGTGHISHEERPDHVHLRILEAARAAGITVRDERRPGNETDGR